MQVGDLVKNNRYRDPESGWIGMVVESEPSHNGLNGKVEPGFWVSYFKEPGEWRWYSFDEHYDIEVISEMKVGDKLSRGL